CSAGVFRTESVVESSDRVDVDPGFTQGVQLLLLALRVRYQVLDVVGGDREHGRTASDLRMVDQGDDPSGACGHGPVRVGDGEGRCRQAEVRGQAVAGEEGGVGAQAEQLGDGAAADECPDGVSEGAADNDDLVL